MVFKARAMAVYMYDIKNHSHGDVSAMCPRRPVSNSAQERMKENLPVCQVFLKMAMVIATYSTGVRTASLRVLMSTPRIKLSQPTGVSSNLSKETGSCLLARSEAPRVVKTASMLAAAAYSPRSCVGL